MDFYCASANLAVELDGESHLDRRNEDELRTKWIESQRITILRYWNPQVFDEKDTVLEAIDRELMARRGTGPGQDSDT